jgi:hypothetical protein
LFFIKVLDQTNLKGAVEITTFIVQKDLINSARSFMISASSLPKTVSVDVKSISGAATPP